MRAQIHRCLFTAAALSLALLNPVPAKSSTKGHSAPFQVAQISAERVERHTRKMMKDLSHRNPKKRAEAAEWLGQRREANAVPALIPLLTDGNDDVRSEAARALWRIGPPAAEPAKETLQQMLGTEQSGQARINVAGALWKLKMPTAEIRPVLRRGLEDYRDWTRVRTATLLHRMGEPLEGLLPVYHDAMAEGSAKLRHRVLSDVLDFEDRSDALIPLGLAGLRDDDETVKVRGIVLLQVLNADSPEVVAELKVATRSRSEFVRDAAIDAFAALPESVQTTGREGDLLSALDDRSASVRTSAAQGLGSLPAQSPDAVSALIAALNDKNDEVRAAAADALGDLGDIAQPAIPYLQALWDDRDLYFTIRHAAGRSLGKLGQAVDWASEG